MAGNKSEKEIPICVDLDETLISSDSLADSIFCALKNHPLIIFLLPFWILKGKYYFKRKILSFYQIKPETLPYRNDLLEFLKLKKDEGRKIILITASLQEVADSVSNHLRLFDEAYGTSSEKNLKSSNKTLFLVEKFGEFGYDYIGDSKADIAVWGKARKSILVEPSSNTLKKVEKFNNIEKVFEKKNNTLKLILKEIRVHQWLKNLLIFLPLLMAHKLDNVELIIKSIIAFFSFSFVASFVYVINDLLDIEADRKHPRKKNRPIASGNLSIKTALVIIPILFILGLGSSLLFLSLEFTIVLLIYLFITTLYSFYLKKIYILDIFILSILYTIRLIGGAVAVDVIVSKWLLAFSVFLFLSLAILKRFTELRVMQMENKNKTSGRGYIVDDLNLISILGPTSGYLSVVIFALYIYSPEVLKLYNVPELLWPVAIFILLWITRIWFLANRNEMDDDPIVFTVKDKTSHLIFSIITILIILATIL
ncbi:MAG: UbiA family prenyltransferase [Candidatus Kapabacteria bacterium]|nr:UbiA family prenyltransferase [Candidatus Kapabacteria bacterium]